MRGLNVLLRTVILLAPLTFVPIANAQIGISVGPPVCPYGYYNYSPYPCAPYGYYGPGYFYNGIFLGVGPWSYWGYRHGWGDHRFIGAGGGRYYGGGRGYYGRGGYGGGRGYAGRGGYGGGRGYAGRGGAAHGGFGGGGRGGGGHGGGGDHGGGGHR